MYKLCPSCIGLVTTPIEWFGLCWCTYVHMHGVHLHRHHQVLVKCHKFILHPPILFHYEQLTNMTFTVHRHWNRMDTMLVFITKNMQQKQCPGRSKFRELPFLVITSLTWGWLWYKHLNSIARIHTWACRQSCSSDPSQEDTRADLCDYGIPHRTKDSHFLCNIKMQMKLEML